MQMFDWWKNGFEFWQHGVKTLLIHPQSFVGVGEWGALNPAAFGGYDFIGTKQPVRFVGSDRRDPHPHGQQRWHADGSAPRRARGSSART
jgi:hypothetical protein